MPAEFDVVVPTVGRGSLGALLSALTQELPESVSVFVVDDRGLPAGGLSMPDDPRLRVLRSGGRGPAAARNLGWRASSARWVAFLDDDVDLPPGWVQALERDLAGAGAEAAASQGVVQVPQPTWRAPTDWERNVAGLDGASWVTADLAVRRSALEDVGGFDERFLRAYREDSDLALRLSDHGWSLAQGSRRLRHPVWPAPWWVSVKLQAGNTYDVLMTRRHGPAWKHRLSSPPGTFRSHRTTVLWGSGALTALTLSRFRGTFARTVAAVAGGVWGFRTGRFAWQRIKPGPRTAREIGAMVVTSVLVPPAACWHRVRGHLRFRGVGSA